MKYICVCSGISSPTAAWRGLGWKPLAYAEIDPFASAILSERYGAGRPRFMPDPAEPGIDEKEARSRANAIKALASVEWGTKVPNFGDFTRLRDETFIVDCDVLVGGTPCQDFSLAGLRASLGGARGNLTMEFIRLANAVDDLRRDAGKPPAFILWENVPGVFSTKDNAFGSFLGGLVGSERPVCPPKGRGWTDAGVVSGPERMAAWRVLDAQHFGLAQRRKRVFVLACRHPRAWAVADALLPILDSLCGHPPPSKEARSGVARSLSASAGGPSAKEQQLTFVAGDRPLNALGGGEGDAPRNAGRSGPGAGGPGGAGGDGDGAVLDPGVPPLAGTVAAKWAKGTGGPAGDEHHNLVAPTPFAPAQITSPGNRSNPMPGDPAPTLAASREPPAVLLAPETAGPILAGTHGAGPRSTEVESANFIVEAPLPSLTARPYSDRGAADEGGLILGEPIAFSSKDDGGDAGDIAPTLRAMNHHHSHQNAGGQIAVAFSMRGRDGENMAEPEADGISPAIRTGGGDSSKPMVAVVFQERGREDGRQVEVAEGDTAYALTAPKGGGRAQEKLVAIVEEEPRAFNIAPLGPNGETGANETDTAYALTAAGEASRNARGTHVVQSPQAFKPSHYTRGKDGAPSEVAPALTADADKGDQDAILFVPVEAKAFTVSENSNAAGWEGDAAATVMARAESPSSNQFSGVRLGSMVRRLTLVECERLQGFPDNFTLIPWSDARRDPDDFAETILYLREHGFGENEARVLASTPDGPRYRVLGNSMARDVIEYLGRQIEVARDLRDGEPVL